MVYAPASSCMERRAECPEVSRSVFAPLYTEKLRANGTVTAFPDYESDAELFGSWNLLSPVCETATWLASGVMARSHHAYSMYNKLKPLHPKDHDALVLPNVDRFSLAVLKWV